MRMRCLGEGEAGRLRGTAAWRAERPAMDGRGETGRLRGTAAWTVERPATEGRAGRSEAKALRHGWQWVRIRNRCMSGTARGLPNAGHGATDVAPRHGWHRQRIEASRASLPRPRNAHNQRASSPRHRRRYPIRMTTANRTAMNALTLPSDL